MQTCTSVANMLFDTIRKAILAEFDHSGGSRPDQSHVADKISAIKWKGKPPHFFKQKGADSESATNNAGPSSSKKRCDHKKGKKPQGSSHHQSHFASTAMVVDRTANMQQATISHAMIVLQPHGLVHPRQQLCHSNPRASLMRVSPSNSLPRPLPVKQASQVH